MTLKSLPIVLCLLIAFTANPGFAQESWNGGPGDWSTCADWTPGCPGSRKRRQNLFRRQRYRDSG